MNWQWVKMLISMKNLYVHHMKDFQSQLSQVFNKWWVITDDFFGALLTSMKETLCPLYVNFNTYFQIFFKIIAWNKIHFWYNIFTFFQMPAVVSRRWAGIKSSNLYLVSIYTVIVNILIFSLYFELLYKTWFIFSIARYNLISTNSTEFWPTLGNVHRWNIGLYTVILEYTGSIFVFSIFA